MIVSADRATLDRNKALVRRFLDEVWNKGNLGIIEEVVAEDFVDHNPAPLPLPHGRKGMQVWFGLLSAAFSDIRITIDQQVAEDDWVVTSTTNHLTHTSEF